MALSDLKTTYAGRKAAMFRLALVTGLLTVATAGFYRFWMKTRMRRYYWSAIQPGGFPLEYVGRPTEKLLGFLTAVVFLSFYIGIVNLILMFFSFSLFQGNAPAYVLSAIGITPLIFFAQYRARRYVLARTRWRGIRFGLEPGVAGFVWRSLLHWGLTVVTLGIYWPAMVWRLEKYRVDRTFYGDKRMNQGGDWKLLFPAMFHLYAAVLMLAVGIGAAVLPGTTVGPTGLPRLTVLAVGLILMGLGWGVIGFGYWKAESFRRLTEAKTLGETGFRTAPRMGRIIGIYFGGWAIIGGLSMVIVIIAGVVIAGLAAMMGIFGEVFEEGDVTALPGFVAFIAGAIVYFGFFILYGVLKETFIALPMAQHLSEVTEIVNPQGLNDVQQRSRDDFAEAEGFADALPLGDAF